MKRTEKSGPTAGEKKKATTAEKSGPTAGERASPTASNVNDTSWKSQASKTTRRAHNDVHRVEKETKFLTAEAPEESTISSTTHVFLWEHDSSRTRLRVGQTDRSETTGADGPGSAWKLSSRSSSTRPSTRPSKLLSRRSDKCRPFKRSRRLLRFRNKSHECACDSAEQNTVEVLQVHT